MRDLWPIFLFASAAYALPMYPYFYPCSSGVVDCSSFVVHHEDSLGPVTYPPEVFAMLGAELGTPVIYASNAIGQYVGGVEDTPDSGGPVPIEGQGSSTHCVAPGSFA